MEILIVTFWLSMIWWKVDGILDVLKDIRDIMKKGGAE
jgi:hypothetical protein